MTKYDSRRILTLKELRAGNKLHGGMIAGKCVTWTVLNTDPQRAILKVVDTVSVCTGKDLRDMAFYPAENCPMCALQHNVEPQQSPELHAIPREILAADVPSSFRFRAAQYRGIKKTR